MRPVMNRGGYDMTARSRAWPAGSGSAHPGSVRRPGSAGRRVGPGQRLRDAPPCEAARAAVQRDRGRRRMEREMTVRTTPEACQLVVGHGSHRSVEVALL